MVVIWYVAGFLCSLLNSIDCTRQLQAHLLSSLKSLCDCSSDVPAGERQETGASGEVEDSD